MDTKEFIEKAKKIHGDKYNYSLVNYVDCLTKVEIICAKHGKFLQNPHVHISNKCGCKKCYLEGSEEKRLKKQVKFIELAKKVHNNKYDYSKVNFKNTHEKVIIICPIHGDFDQEPMSHIHKKCGCPKCSKLNKIKGNYLKNKWNTKSFIEKCEDQDKKIGITYDYSKVEYNGSNKKITIICKKHGPFYQLPNARLKGQICKKCFNDSRKIILEEFICRANQIHNNKYKYPENLKINNNTQKIEIECPIHGKFHQTISSHLSGRGCKKCSYTGTINNNKNKTIKRLENFLDRHDQNFETNLVTKEITYPQDGGPAKIVLVCSKHGQIELTTSGIYSSLGCNKCSSQTSKLEIFIEDFLIKNDIKYQIHDRTNLNGKEIDIFIPSKNLGIECHGIYWHSESILGDKNYHLNKLKEAKEKNINLIQIFENEIITKPKIVLSRLKNIFGILKYKIYARKCVIKEINGNICNKFLEKYHLQGKDNSPIRLGLFYKNRLISVMTFCKPRKCLGKKTKENYYELCRFCSISNFSIIGGASKLLKFFENNYSPKYIISYADKRWSNGYLYKILGFKHIHDSPPNYWYFNKKSIYKLYHRFKFKKNTLNKYLEKFDSSLTEYENMKNNGYDRIWDCGNMVFEKIY